jgi:DGQHR domain-containing protein
LGESTAVIRLPDQFTGSNWEPSQLHPIEVIDGQHRLWAFEERGVNGDFELPVVAFHGLDISWQAYLFWTINIKPKRINASLAFDLYPLLRTENWLERFEGHSIYRETRAQELTEALWAHPESPWYQRINMLGETGLKEAMVSQAAWIRSLMATYVKASEGKRVTIGGLFGAPVGSSEEALPWSRAQQAAFLILMGQKIRNAINNCREPWAEALRHAQQSSLFEDEHDRAFASPYTLLNTDQGIRGILYVTNDLCYIRTQEFDLESWTTDEDAGAVDEKAVSQALKSLGTQRVARFLDDIANSLAKYDWRTSSAPGLAEEERTLKAAFRGSGGYRELRRQLLRHLAHETGRIGEAAKEVLNVLRYE